MVLNRDVTRGEAALKKSATLNPAPNAMASAGGLNNIAYQIAGAGMLDDAIAILNAAVDLYPEDANLYDSLGEFQLKEGDKAKALESYKKALEKNPKFGNATNAQEIVKKLTAELKGS